MATTANDDAKCTPTFSGFLNATGHSEMWNLVKVGNQSSDWSSSANEKRYTQGTLIGNWNEDQFDVKEIIKPTPLPSQYGHYFDTTYSASYSHSRKQSNNVKKVLRTPSGISKAFPGHQPERDTPKQQQSYKTFITCSQDAYKRHQ